MAEGLLIRWSDESTGTQERELAANTVVTIGRAPDNAIVLAGAMLSRNHARIRIEGGRTFIDDLGSKNGTFVNEEKVTTVELRPGDEFSLGGVTFSVHGPPGSEDNGPTLAGTLFLDANALHHDLEERAAAGGTVVVGGGTVVVPSQPQAPSARVAVSSTPGIVSEEMLAHPVISEREWRAAGIEIETAEFVALGGGLGSFVLTDLLRCSGMNARDITVLGSDKAPMARYDRLCANSQIPRHERLRSNSDSCPDNPWGFPGYAFREGTRELAHGNLKLAGEIFWKIFGEPAISQTYTPRLGDVVKSVDREAERIGWSSMLRLGRIRAIRKTEEGRLLAVLSQSSGTTRKHLAVSSRAMHLAIGYPAIQMLPDLAAYREKYNDEARVVNAYENHDQVYESLRKKGGVVLLRGRGIVASRLIQRLWEERKTNDKIQVIHLHRSKLTEGARWGMGRRKVEEQFEFQPFNWPKSSWGGEHNAILERASLEERKALLDAWGGTTTANRTDWRRMVKEGVKQGWYRPEYGVVEDVSLTNDGRVATRIGGVLAGGGQLELKADWVVDCTGLVASPTRSPLLADLISTYNVPLGPTGRLAVTNRFEVEAMRHGESRFYAAGAMTLGGPVSAVDSFLGLQMAASKTTKDMQSMDLRGLHDMNGFRSFRKWLKWARKAAP
jgi:pSer/pThr/pTyr-binding forkhead associated (FHA) protein